MSKTSTPIIEVYNLTRKFGKLKAVDHLTFDSREGEIFGILGPNGAGKTTTLRLLASLILPSEGSANIGGYNITTESLKVRERVGILTENPSLYERLTAYENMDFFAEAYGLSNAREKKERIRELLEFFQLWERRYNKVATFSKGMKQKLAIARTLIHKPPILFLDEPTASLDPESSKNIRELIATLSKNERHTVLLSTHRLEDAEKLCSRVMIINHGKRVFVGTPNELQDNMTAPPKLHIALTKVTQKVVNTLKADKHVRDIIVDEAAASLLITIDDAPIVTPEIIKKLVYAGGLILSVSLLRPSLEEAYLKLVTEEQ